MGEMDQVMKLTPDQKYILEIINRNPKCADNDTLLIEQVWLSQDWSSNRSLYENLCSVMKPDSITRARRKLHEYGYIKYAKEVEQGRYEKFKETREEHSAVSWLNDQS